MSCKKFCNSNNQRRINMESLTFKEMMSVSYVIPVLLVLSVLCIMFAMERWLYFARFARVSNRSLDRIRLNLKNGNLKDAKHEALKSGGLAAEAIAAQIDAAHLPRQE